MKTQLPEVMTKYNIKLEIVVNDRGFQDQVICVNQS